MWGEKSVYPTIETEFAFRLFVIDVYFEAFNSQLLNQNGIESAILRNKYYNPPNFIFQHLPVKEKVKKLKLKYWEMDISLTL